MSGEIKYKLVVFARGASIVAEGSAVTTPSGTEYPLSEFWAGPGKLRYFDAPMTDDIPETGEYKFSLKFSGSSQNFQSSSCIKQQIEW